ncbi:MAG: class I SAM-dependent methyltransferase [Desulfomonile tiedjei]|nr:class I SAM-dependent methyltransferase [Desulfomonile tiedjei]
MQTAVTIQWHQDVKAIYDQYDMYLLSGGVEQQVLWGSPSIDRSARILSRLQEEVRIPKEGRLLDAGCGNGSLLRISSRVFPQWRLTGLEQNDRWRGEVEEIPGVERFHCESIEALQGPFDLITLIHTLEHVCDPVPFLEKLARKLAPDGLLLVQVPDLRENPFDLVVADHCSHFLTESLVGLMKAAGLDVVLTATDWVPKEISVVSRAWPVRGQSEDGKPAGSATSAVPQSVRIDARPLSNLPSQVVVARAVVKSSSDYLLEMAAHARQVSAGGSFGIFGTAIAGTWLAGTVGPAVQFFVDEDLFRINQTHLNKPVLSVEDAPVNSSVYLALPPRLARSVHERLKKAQRSFELVLPPDATEEDL